VENRASSSYGTETTGQHNARRRGSFVPTLWETCHDPSRLGLSQCLYLPNKSVRTILLSASPRASKALLNASVTLRSHYYSTNKTGWMEDHLVVTAKRTVAIFALVAADCLFVGTLSQIGPAHRNHDCE
jgi:hypothetical protein